MTATVAGIHLGLDIHANRPAANTVPDGSLYSCSTHSLIYKSDYAGNSWATWRASSGVADILDLTTAETDSSLVLAPDGAGGVEFRAETGGGGSVLDPIEELFGTPDDAHEFETSTIGGTAVGTATTMDAHTTIPHHLFIKKAATSSIAVTGNVWAATAPFTAICKIDGSTPGQINFVRYGMLGITTSSPTSGKLECIEMFYNSGPLFGGVTYTSPTGSTGAIGTNITEQKNNAPFYLAVVATSTTNIAYYVSHGGWLWYRHTTGRDPSMTIANVGVFIQPQNTTFDSTVAYDFLRIWNSAKTFPF